MNSTRQSGLTIMILAGLAFAAIPASAQTFEAKKPAWFETGRSMKSSAAGQKIVSWPTDPFTTAEQEAVMIRFLHSPFPFSWKGDETLADLQRELAEHVPCLLNQRALEEFGLASDEPFVPPANAIIPPSSVDRHADVEEETPAPEPKPTSWWESETHRTSDVGARKAAARRDRPGGIRLTVGGVLYEYLNLLDLTLNIQSGQLVITTKEDALDNPSLRVYDVTPLIDETAHTLIEHIENSVDPTMWEMLGGVSTAYAYTVGGKHWLVVNTTTLTHLKIQSLLDRLNQ